MNVTTIRKKKTFCKIDKREDTQEQLKFLVEFELHLQGINNNIFFSLSMKPNMFFTICVVRFDAPSGAFLLLYGKQ